MARILGSAKLLRHGIRVEVGNGKQTSFWHHNWILNKPLSQMTTSPIPSSLENLTVNDCWDENNG